MAFLEWNETAVLVRNPGPTRDHRRVLWGLLQSSNKNNNNNTSRKKRYLDPHPDDTPTAVFQTRMRMVLFSSRPFHPMWPRVSWRLPVTNLTAATMTGRLVVMRSWVPSVAPGHPRGKVGFMSTRPFGRDCRIQVLVSAWVWRDKPSCGRLPRELISSAP